MHNNVLFILEFYVLAAVYFYKTCDLFLSGTIDHIGVENFQFHNDIFPKLFLSI